jgi:uncharacterized protein
MSRNGDFIQTYTKKKMYPLDPLPEEIDIVDIAHGLSNLCRFTGQCSEFYSVCTHSLYVSKFVSHEHALWGLLHDASEAYINDVSRPVKHDPRFAVYREIEANLQAVIIKKFGLPPEQPEDVTKFDTILLVTEARDLNLLTSEWRDYKVQPLVWPIIPQTPKEAEQAFLERYQELKKSV